MATLIKTDCSQTEVFPKDKENGFTLDEVYALIGCELVEIACRFEDGKMMLVDEEGLLKPDPEVNPLASMLFGDYIVGNALIVEDEEFQ